MNSQIKANQLPYLLEGLNNLEEVHRKIPGNQSIKQEIENYQERIEEALNNE
jgi:carbon monoxide dehydrogenase subunit G